jgi:hypothetical protein
MLLRCVARLVKQANLAVQERTTGSEVHLESELPETSLGSLKSYLVLEHQQIQQWKSLSFVLHAAANAVSLLHACTAGSLRHSGWAL